MSGIEVFLLGAIAAAGGTWVVRKVKRWREKRRHRQQLRAQQLLLEAGQPTRLLRDIDTPALAESVERVVPPGGGAAYFVREPASPTPAAYSFADPPLVQARAQAVHLHAFSAPLPQRSYAASAPPPLPRSAQLAQQRLLTDPMPTRYIADGYDGGLSLGSGIGSGSSAGGGLPIDAIDAQARAIAAAQDSRRWV